MRLGGGENAKQGGKKNLVMERRAPGGWGECLLSVPSYIWTLCPLKRIQSLPPTKTLNKIL